MNARAIVCAGGLVFAATVSSAPAHAAVTLLLAAGGGGGAGEIEFGFPGLATTSGGAGYGAGGVNGLGGVGGGSPGANGAGGGAGWLGSGLSGLLPSVHASNGGSSFPTFAGGFSPSGRGVGQTGGFGGGGGGLQFDGGGGGGYSGGGGGGGVYGGAGGGGSYIGATFTNIVSQPGSLGVEGVPSIDGSVEIDGTVFGFTGSIADYIAPATGVYDIVAEGAQGGSQTSAFLNPGGAGAEVGGDVWLPVGTELAIVVGGAGESALYAGGGGGGSFVWIASEPSVVPEPSTWAMMALGFMGLGWAARRSGKARAASA
jgi:hypothetical protein